jgi:rfaE bifunctional protein nucleotidyltransferase chain/domain
MSVSKIVSVSQLAVVAQQCGESGRVLVFTNGCFDLLHVGHVRYLQAARTRGDLLAVAVNGDESVRALKGPSRPVNSELDRAEVLAALGCIDYVVLFHTPRATSVISEVRPQLYVKGGDYTVDALDPGERQALEEVGARIEILQLVPGKSTTAVIHKLAANNSVSSA